MCWYGRRWSKRQQRAWLPAAGKEVVFWGLLIRGDIAQRQVCFMDPQHPAMPVQRESRAPTE